MAIVRFDEVYAFKSEKSKYVCVLLDFKKQIPVDVLPNRKKEYLLNYFQKIPLEELHMTGKWCACSAPSVYL